MRTYIKDTRHGKFLLLHGDMVSEFVNLYGEWCEGEVELFSKILPSDAGVIEVGANIGTHSIPLAKICHKGKVVCFEPQRIIFQMLCANAAMNNVTNLHAVHAGVADKACVINLAVSDYEKPWNYGAFSLDCGYDTEGKYESATSSEMTSVVTLDQYATDNKLARLDLIKIDAEGYEEKVLIGASEVVSKFRPMLFIENNKATTGDTLIEKLRSLDYRCYWYPSARFRPTNFNGSSWRISGVDINMLCIAATDKNTFGLVPASSFEDLKNKKIPLY